MAEAWQSYANLVGNLTRNVRERAVSTARALLTQAGLEDVAMDAGERLTNLIAEIWQASRANRELVENLIAAEVDKAAGRLGLVRSEELQELRAEVAELRERIRTAPQTAGRARKAPGKRAPAKKAAMKKAAETAAETSAAAG